MKAIIYDAYGGPAVLRLADLDEPKVPQNSILLRVRAAGVNPADLALRAGMGAAFMDAVFPVVPGWDVAGVVERVGAGVSEFAPGDAVLGFLYQDLLHTGTYAEFVAAPASMFVAKPAALSWQQAAALPLAGVTAVQALARLDIRSGETLLIHGASGGVGSLAAQLAQQHGATVIGAAAPANHAFLRSIGVTPVRYGATLVEEVRALAPGGVDAVVDCAGRDALSSNSAVGRAGLRSVSIAGGAAGTTTVFARPSLPDLQHVASLAGQGRLQIRVSAQFSLADAADAHRYLEHSGSHGKVVLMME